MQTQFNFTCDIILSSVTLLSLIALIISNALQYAQMNKQLRIQNEQMKQNFFSEYTKRYQKIILNFPENINEDNFSFALLDGATRDKTMRYMRVYFDLCSEEFFLHTKEHLDETVWKEWKQGMTYAFKKAAFKQAWDIIGKDTGFYTEFADFVQTILGSNLET